MADVLIQPVTVPATAGSAFAGGNGSSSATGLSADGRYAVFVSAAQNLTSPRLSGRHLNVYLHDRVIGTNRLVTVALGWNGGGDGDSPYATVSADGRYVALESRAQNLVTNSTSGAGDIFLYDAGNSSVTLVSRNLAGTSGGNAVSRDPILTPDGRWLLFQSEATDLVTNKLYGLGDLYLYDRQTGQTILVTVDPLGAAGGLSRSLPAGLSADGRWVLYSTTATNLVRPLFQNTLGSAILLRDMAGGGTAYAILGTNGAPPSPGSVANVQLSADGRHLAFVSTAIGLTTNVTTNLPSLYWRDLDALSTRWVRTASGSGAYQFVPVVLSLDGSKLAFSYTNQVYLWDASIGATSLLSLSTNGGPAGGVSRATAFSQDGNLVAFVSTAPNLTTEATTGSLQVFARDLGSGVTRRISLRADGKAAGAGDALYPMLSADGRVALFEGQDTALVDGLAPEVSDVFIGEVASPGVELVSRGAPGIVPATVTTGGTPSVSAVSADGRYVLFTVSVGRAGTRRGVRWRG